MEDTARKIRKGDIVYLRDGSCGKVLQIVTKEPTTVFKIENLNKKRIDYFDESKLLLKVQHLENKLKDLMGIA